MIKLLFLDVDGMFIDGLLYFDENFYEIKVFNVKDGFGMMLW